MTQATIDMPAQTLQVARAVGLAGQQLAIDRAERDLPDFRALAEAAILTKLADGPASAEDLTDHVRASGVEFRDGRALGPVYRSLRDRGLIRIVGECFRRKGHGTSGGHMWGLCT